MAYGGVSKLLSVPRPSLASDAVAQCFFFISCDEDMLEKLCLLAEPMLEEIFRVMLWCMESGHESGRQFANMFIGNTCAFRQVKRESFQVTSSSLMGCFSLEMYIKKHSKSRELRKK